MSTQPRSRADVPGPGDAVEIEFVDHPTPETKEIFVIPASGLPVRLQHEGVDYGLAGGHLGEPVHFDYHRLDGDTDLP